MGRRGSQAWTHHRTSTIKASRSATRSVCADAVVQRGELRRAWGTGGARGEVEALPVRRRRRRNAGRARVERPIRLRAARVEFLKKLRRSNALGDAIFERGQVGATRTLAGATR